MLDQRYSLILLFIPILIFILIHDNVHSIPPTSTPQIICKTPLENRQITILNNQLFYSINDKTPVSTKSSLKMVSSKKQIKLIAEFKIEKDRNKLYIDDINSFDSFEDYLDVSNKEGHHIIYPLECSYLLNEKNIELVDN